MRKIVLALMLIVSSVCVAQDETVLLRVNYNEGDQYKMVMTMNQNLTSAGMKTNTSMEMLMDIIGEEDDEYSTKMKFTRIVMDILQGGSHMRYDSNEKDKDLDESSKQLEAQLLPMLQIAVFSRQNKLGKIFDVVVKPNVPNAEQYSNSNSIEFPEEVVKVGSSWSTEKMNQGLKSLLKYTVTEINETTVTAKISGKFEGVAGGEINGEVELDRDSGIQNKMILIFDLKGNGESMKINIKVTMEKV